MLQWMAFFDVDEVSFFLWRIDLITVNHDLCTLKVLPFPCRHRYVGITAKLGFELQFLVIKDHRYHANLLGFLRGYEDYAALAINWRVRISESHKINPVYTGSQLSRTPLTLSASEL